MDLDTPFGIAHPITRWDGPDAPYTIHHTSTWWRQGNTVTQIYEADAHPIFLFYLIHQPSYQRYLATLRQTGKTTIQAANPLTHHSLDQLIWTDGETYWYTYPNIPLHPNHKQQLQDKIKEILDPA